MVDTSGDIDSSCFQLFRELIANIIDNLVHNSPKSAVGVILFSSSAHVQFNVQAHTSLYTLLSAINQLPYIGGETNTAEALTLLLSTAQNGTLGSRDDSSKTAIVITNGRSNSRSATLSAASSLHASSIFDVYAVGVNGADLTELQAIASSPEFVFFTSPFDSDDLQQLQREILPHLCYGNFTDNNHILTCLCIYPYV